MSRPEPRVDPTAAHVVDVFVYVVVLNLFVQYLPAVLSETFTLTVLTALLLKVVLEIVVSVKKRIGRRFTSATRAGGKVLAAALLWGVLFGSKFVVLELVDRAFDGAVRLGGFVSVTALVVVLMLARGAVHRLLGPTPTSGRVRRERLVRRSPAG